MSRGPFRLAVAGFVCIVAMMVGVTPAAAAQPTITPPTTDLPESGATPSTFGVRTTITLEENLDQRTADAVAELVRDGSVVSSATARNSGDQKSWEPSLSLSVKATDRNGPHTIIARATGRTTDNCLLAPLCIGEQPARVTVSASAPTALAVPPLAPAAPKATRDTKSRSVTVEWPANPEPDIVEYILLRKPPGGAFQPIARIGQRPAGTTVRHVDKALPAPGGDYVYRLRVSRAGASGAVDPKAKDLLVTEDPARTGTAKGVPTDPGAAPPGVPPPVDIVNVPGGAPTGSVTPIPQVNASAPSIANAPAVTGTTIPGGTFDPVLPFDVEPGETGEDAARLTLPNDQASTSRRPIIFYVAAALLAVAVAMHLLWLRREVGKVPPDGLVALGPTGNGLDGSAGATGGPAAFLARVRHSQLPRLARRLRRRSAEAPVGSEDGWFGEEIDQQTSEKEGAAASTDAGRDGTGARPAEASPAGAKAVSGGPAPPRGELLEDADPGHGRGEPADTSSAPPPAERRLVVSIGGPRQR